MSTGLNSLTTLHRRSPNIPYLPPVTKMRAISGLCACALLGAIVGLGGCAAVEDKPEKKVAAGQVYWPAPPAQPRFAYAATLRSSEDIRPKETDAERLRRSLIAGELPEIQTFKKPFGVAARGGRVYVTDTEARVVRVFDLPRRKFYTFGVRQEGRLAKPIGIAVDAKGNVYVADATSRAVIKYDTLGLYLATIGAKDELRHPNSVAVSPDGSRVYVVDTGGLDTDRHRVVMYDAAGAKVGEFGRRGKGDGEFNLPTDVAVAPDGTVYVLDSGNFRVQAFEAGGEFLRAFGSNGSNLGQFARPRGIATDPEGNIYVTDGFFRNVQVFNPRGQLLLPFGSGSRDQVDEPARFMLPAGVTVDERGNVYVVDQFLHKIEVFRRVSEEEGRRLMTSGG